MTFDAFSEFDAPPPVDRKPTRNKFGWYNNLPPVPGHNSGPYPNVTTVCHTLSDTYHLNLWQQRQVVLGLHNQPTLLDEIKGRTKPVSNKTKAGKDLLNKIVEQAKENAGATDGASLGTRFHEITEAADRGEDPGDLSDDEQTMLDAYLAEIDKQGIKPIHNLIERIVYIPEINACGTLDRVYSDNGVMRIGDVKTQKSLAFSFMDIPAQLAAYSRAEFYLDTDTWTWETATEVDQERGVVLWVPTESPGKAETHDIDLTFGWKIAKASAKTREWRNHKGSMLRRS